MSSIRAARSTDLDAVAVLEFELLGLSAWSPRAVEAEFEALGDSRFIVVAEAAESDADSGEQQRIVGYAIGWYVGAVADIQRVAVTPHHRRRGLATALLRKLIDEADRRSCERVMLEVAADNAAAIELYAKEGFEEIDRRPRYYPDDVDALVMMRPSDHGGQNG